jgi:hypothetical protein
MLAMTRAHRLVTMLLPAMASLLLVQTADADPLPQHLRPHYRADGSVKVGTQVFPTRYAYATSKLFQDSGARCGTPEPPAVAEASPSDCGYQNTVINPEYDDDRTFVIQVVFHVVKQNATVGNVTPALINSQMEILNEDFQALAGTPGSAGHNVKLEFVLAKFDPAGLPTSGIEVVTNATWFNDNAGGDAMKTALNWDPTRYLNIYTNDAAGYLGYATFPSGGGAGGSHDGVVMLWNTVGRDAPYGPPYNQGRTLTHEIGHYLGLHHTFNDGCSTGNQYTSGDAVADTTPEASSTFGCPIGQTSCGGQLSPIENYMDYSDDTCMTRFTPEQGNRIRCSLWNYRTLNTKPTAAFTFSADLLDVSFTSTSTDAETTPAQLNYRWTFGDGMMATTQSPNHTYATAGTYTVTLEVIDEGSGTSEVTEQVVVVSSIPDAAPPRPDADPDRPDADPLAPDADPNNPGDGDGGGCCQTQGAGPSYLLCGIPVLLVFRRRRRAAERVV